MTTTSITDESKTSSSVDAVLIWWDLELYTNITYTTDPHSAPFQDLWHPCLHWLESPIVCDEQVLLVHAQHDDYQIRVLVTEKSPGPKRPKLVLPSPISAIVQAERRVERSWQLGNIGRRECIQRVFGKLLRDLKTSCVLLDVSDFCWAGSMAASCWPDTSPSCQIISLESSSGKLPLQTAEYIETRHKNSPSSVTFEVRQCYTEQLQPNNTPTVDIVVAEPYYEVLEGWHLQEALNFYGILSVLRVNQIISPSIKIVPQKCQVWGCLVESDDLGSAYKRCGDNRAGRICSFDHSFVNNLMWGSSFPTLALPLWQHDYKALSEPFELGCLNYIDPSSSVLSATTTVKLCVPGRIDAMKVWVDYDLDDDEGATITTNNRMHNQLLHMLDHPLNAKENAEVQCYAKLGEAVEGNDDHFFQVQLLPENENILT